MGLTWLRHKKLVNGSIWFCFSYRSNQKIYISTILLDVELKLVAIEKRGACVFKDRAEKTNKQILSQDCDQGFDFTIIRVGI